MDNNSGSTARTENSLLDPARTGRNLHRRIYESGVGDVLDHLELGSARGFMHLCRVLPASARRELATLIRDIGFQILTRQRQICYGNLTIAKGSVWDPERIRRFTKQIFGYWSRAFIDFARFRLKLTRDNWEQFFAYSGLDICDRALEEHGGAILAGPHIGNWEFATQVLVLNGYSVTSVARRRKKSSSIDRDLLNWRTKWGQRILYKDESPRQILRRLQNGELIGMVTDQYAGRDGVFTDFFGAPTSHYAGPAVLADRAEVPVIPAYCYRHEGHGKYMAVAKDPIYPDRSRSREQRVQQLTSELFEAFEEIIRTHPKQWLWFHRKWREKWLPDEYLDLLKSAPYISSD